MRLRIRERRVDGRNITCPDCDSVLELGLDGKEIVASVISAAEPLPELPANPKARRKTKKKTAPVEKPAAAAPSFLDSVKSPRGIAWVISGLITVCFLGYMLSGESTATPTASPTVPKLTQAKPVIPQNNEYEKATQKSGDPNDQSNSTKANDTKAGDTPANNNGNENPGDETLVNIDAPPPADEPEDGDPLANANGNREQPQPHDQPPVDPAVAQNPQPPGVDPEGGDDGPAIPKKQPIDFDKVLSQKILAYEIVEPVSISELMIEIGELAAVPIRFHESVTAEQQAKKISVSLNKTTVGAILDQILKEAVLIKVQSEDAIEIRSEAN